MQTPYAVVVDGAQRFEYADLRAAQRFFDSVIADCLAISSAQVALYAYDGVIAEKAIGETWLRVCRPTYLARVAEPISLALAQ